MGLWDGALGQPVTELHGQAAGNVITRAAPKLRAGLPVPWSGDGARMLEFMQHLCACDPAWIVRVETPAVVSYFELAGGVLAGVITREQAVHVACERGGAEVGARGMLNWAKAALDHQAEPGGGQTGRPCY